jgi:hypothetical protein
MLEYPLAGKLFSLILSDIDDDQVLDQRRDSNMTMSGVGTYGKHMRATQHYGQSRFKTIVQKT